jgi:hypothetical protein
MADNDKVPQLVIGRQTRPKSPEETMKIRLVYRLAYNGDVAAGQLAVFQGASEVPIFDPYGPSEQRGKTANWPRPGGLR